MDNRSYVEAVEEVAPREISVPNETSRLKNSVVATCKVTTDFLLIKSILKDIQTTVEYISLLGDNQMLLTFNYNESKEGFLNLQDSLQDIFSSVKD